MPTHDSTGQPEKMQVGPFCVGSREGHNVVLPADFARQLDEVQRVADFTFWSLAADALRRAATSSNGRLSRDLREALAQAIQSGLHGILPKAFAAAANVNVATTSHTFGRRELRAVAYKLAVEQGLVVDPTPAKRLKDRFGITARTWFRWREKFKEPAETYLFLVLCDGRIMSDLTQPWASLSMRVLLDIATDGEARELHVARGGRFVTGRDGQEVWVLGDLNPPDS